MCTIHIFCQHSSRICAGKELGIRNQIMHTHIAMLRDKQLPMAYVNAAGHAGLLVSFYCSFFAMLTLRCCVLSPRVLVINLGRSQQYAGQPVIRCMFYAHTVAMSTCASSDMLLVIPKGPYILSCAYLIVVMRCHDKWYKEGRKLWALTTSITFHFHLFSRELVHHTSTHCYQEHKGEREIIT